jgi:hypothetical protein
MTGHVRFGGVGLRHSTDEADDNEDKTSAEPEEERAQAKENDAHPHTHPTPSGARVSQGLGGVRQKARSSKQERFTALLHHLTIDLLRENYYALTAERSAWSRRSELAPV